MSDEAVTYEGDGAVARITINRADRLNRLDSSIIDGLHQAGTDLWRPMSIASQW